MAPLRVTLIESGPRTLKWAHLRRTGLQTLGFQPGPERSWPENRQDAQALCGPGLKDLVLGRLDFLFATVVPEGPGA